MSMISEQIEKLQLLSAELKDNLEYWHVISEGEAHNWQRAVDSAITTIKELSAKVAAESMERSSRYYNGGWIPCDNISPDDGENVLCTDGSNIYLVEFDIINMDAPYGNIDNIIAWMPLPEPYLEEKAMQKINDEQEEKLDINEEIRELNHVLRTSLHEIESFDAKTEKLKPYGEEVNDDKCRRNQKHDR